MKTLKWVRSWVVLGGLAATLGLGCSKTEDADPAQATTPEKAATQLEQAFQGAQAQAAENARLAAEAMQRKEYEKAVLSLQAIRSSENLTLNQGIAIHSSVVSLEAQLIQAIQAGDPNAKRTYDMLKALKRD
ncbi:MAG: hypothetical protein FJ387_24405 [Verrucomicrobia bacterium]|nr:hypothetical protein [Verrucomicrobiota bacterium]